MCTETESSQSFSQGRRQRTVEGFLFFSYTSVKSINTNEKLVSITNMSGAKNSLLLFLL